MCSLPRGVPHHEHECWAAGLVARVSIACRKRSDGLLPPVVNGRESVGQSWRLQGASLEIRAHGRAAVAGVRPIGRARRPSQRGETPRSASRLKTACYRLDAVVRDRCQRSQWTATRKGLALARASRFDGSIPGAAAEMRVPVASEGRGPGNLLPRRIASLASFVESDIYDLATD